MWLTSSDKANESVVALTLAMISSVACVPEGSAPKYLGEEVVSRAIATRWIEAAEEWIAAHSQKHADLIYFQIRCVIIVAKFLVGMKLKSWWQETGSLVRFAMGAGLHLDPSIARVGSTISPFDREMRRRIWATITELELLASLHRGTNSCVSGVDSDCGCPSNMDDNLLNQANDGQI